MPNVYKQFGKFLQLHPVYHLVPNPNVSLNKIKTVCKCKITIFSLHKNYNLFLDLCPVRLWNINICSVQQYIKLVYIVHTTSTTITVIPSIKTSSLPIRKLKNQISQILLWKCYVVCVTLYLVYFKIFDCWMFWTSKKNSESCT